MEKGLILEKKDKKEAEELGMLIKLLDKQEKRDVLMILKGMSLAKKFQGNKAS